MTIVSESCMDGWIIDWKKRSFSWFSRSVKLSRAELIIMEHLISNPGVIATKSKILRLIGTNSHDGKVRDIYLCRIRSALDGVFGNDHTPIKSVWGRGTYFKLPGQMDIPVTPIIPEELNVRKVVRWTRYLKYYVFCKVKSGEIDKNELFLRNSINEEEFSEWGELFKTEY